MNSCLTVSRRSRKGFKGLWNAIIVVARDVQRKENKALGGQALH